jgi:hypothetical protein
MDPNTAGWVLIAALALPLVGAALMLLLPKDDEQRIMRFAVLVTGVSFALVTAMTARVRLQPLRRAAVRHERRLDRRDQRALPPRDRRHLAAAVLPELPAAVPQRDLHDEAPAGAGQAQGLPRP